MSKIFLGHSLCQQAPHKAPPGGKNYYLIAPFALQFVDGVCSMFLRKSWALDNLLNQPTRFFQKSYKAPYFTIESPNLSMSSARRKSPA